MTNDRVTDNLSLLVESEVLRLIGTVLHSSTELTKLLRWLCHNDGIIITVVTYRSRSTGTPTYLASLMNDDRPSCQLHSSNDNLLTKPTIKLLLADRAFSVSAPPMWNSLTSASQSATCIITIRHIN